MEKKKNRQYRSRPGREDEQYATSMAKFNVTAVGLAMLLIVAIIL